MTCPHYTSAESAMVAVGHSSDALYKRASSSAHLAEKATYSRHACSKVFVIRIEAVINYGHANPGTTCRVPGFLCAHIRTRCTSVLAGVIPLPLLCKAWVVRREPLRNMLDKGWLSQSESFVLM